ncbi:MAG: LTA synthase family protein [Bacteroidales bacterium]|jgi:phosphoglycerol transferase MdoB-like AlkP superfamily enzyme|nr:LTA synthase family protein [Bacteroidales bacterium]MCI2134422.1 LTA synthase family protein [Bacteroidales bacterium]
MISYEDYSQEPRKVFDWMRLLAPKIILLSVVLGAITRIILALISPGSINAGFIGWMEIFGLGILNDACFAILSLAPAFAIYIFLNDVKYKKGLGWLIIIILTAATAYSFYPENFFSSYAQWVTKLARIIASALLVGFCIKFFVPQIRNAWRGLTLTLVEFCYVLAGIVNLLGECLYWHQFGVRYNFIAVDRLFYSESAMRASLAEYPVIPIAIALTLIAIFVTWKMFRKYSVGESSNMGFSNTMAMLVLFALLSFGSLKWLDFSSQKIKNSSVTATELQDNGCWKIINAYNSGKLEYYRFYPVIPTIQAQKTADELLSKGLNAKDSTDEIPKNIVLITLESINNEYIDEGLCPFLASLEKESLSFKNMYASGPSMAKGIDALTLCTPPTPGRSVAYQLNKKVPAGLPTIGKALQSSGYATAFIYGGNGRRSNLRRYFSQNGYNVIEKKDFRDISFENSMGACDDDTYEEVLEYADKRAKLGKPFLAHVLTLSSHSPYSYPGSKLIGKDERKEAVTYTDEALSRFFDSASKKPWFGNTIFVVVSDRGSEKSNENGPQLNYFRIPALIYSPGFVPPAENDKLCSQIDLMPTLLSMLHIQPEKNFYGRNILASDFDERAFVSNFLQLGYLKDSTLTVLQPMREITAFRIEGGEQIKVTEPDATLQKETQALYQCASDLF